MTQTVNVLGQSVAVQFSGVEDRSEVTPIGGNSTGLIVGSFRRGRIDKPMYITNSNIRSELGYEPNNRYYQAVQNALDDFSFIWVMRIENPPISLFIPLLLDGSWLLDGSHILDGEV